MKKRLIAFSAGVLVLNSLYSPASIAAAPVDVTTTAQGLSYHFAHGTSGWKQEGTWQAQWGSPALESSQDTGKPTLKLNVEWAGRHDWEEVKIYNAEIPDFAQMRKLSFDILLPAENISAGGLRPYAALRDGWVKLDLDKNNRDIAGMEKVNLSGKTYLKQHVVINLGDGSHRPDVAIGIVGNKLKYSGPVYLDNITFSK